MHRQSECDESPRRRLRPGAVTEAPGADDRCTPSAVAAASIFCLLKQLHWPRRSGARWETWEGGVRAQTPNKQTNKS